MNGAIYGIFTAAFYNVYVVALFSEFSCGYIDTNTLSFNKTARHILCLLSEFDNVNYM